MAIAMPTLLQANMLSRLMNLRNAEILLASQHIATGRRVATARDDPSGMARIQGMESQVRGLNQAERNIQQGISLLQTADGGAEEIRSTITDLQTLVTQAGDATLSASDLNAIQTQVDTLLTSIDTTANGTQFNGIDLLNGTASGGSSAQQVTFTDTRIDGASATGVTDGSYNMTVTTLPKRTTAVGNDINNGNIAAGSITVNGTSASWTTGSASEVVAQLNSSLSAIGITASLVEFGGTYTLDDGNSYSPASGKNKIVLQNDSYGAITMTLGGADLASLGLNGVNPNLAPYAGTDIAGSFSPAFTTTTGSGLALTGTTGGATLAVTVDGAAHGSSLGWSAGATLGPLTVSSALPSGVSTFDMQTGANAGETTTITTYNLSTAYLGITTLDVTTGAGRTAAATALSSAASLVDNARASIGAAEQGLQSLLTGTQNTITNLSAAQSNIRDVDAAAEMTRLATLQILQNASAALLAQAGSSTQQVFQVLFSSGLVR